MKPLDCAIGQAALIASLWPEPTRQCIGSPLYELMLAPATFGALHRFQWRDAPERDASALQLRLEAAFARSR